MKYSHLNVIKPQLKFIMVPRPGKQMVFHSCWLASPSLHARRAAAVLLNGINDKPSLGGVSRARYINPWYQFRCESACCLAACLPPARPRFIAETPGPWLFIKSSDSFRLVRCDRRNSFRVALNISRARYVTSRILPFFSPPWVVVLRNWKTRAE